MEEKIYVIRGAVSPVENTQAEISEKTTELVKQIIEKNNLRQNRIIAIVLSNTSDINAYYPATALRLSGITDAPLFSAAEPDIEGSMPKTVRVMILAAFTLVSPEIKHIYLGNAAALRRDISEDKKEEDK